MPNTFDDQKQFLSWFRLHGDTYAVKEELKALGCRWNSLERCWMCPPDQDKYEQVMNLIKNCEGQMSFEEQDR